MPHTKERDEAGPHTLGKEVVRMPHTGETGETGPRTHEGGGAQLKAQEWQEAGVSHGSQAAVLPLGAGKRRVLGRVRGPLLRCARGLLCVPLLCARRVCSRRHAGRYGKARLCLIA